MKVALIHIRYIYKGGLETRLFNYIDYFLDRGDEVHLYTSKVADDIVPPKNLIIHLLDVKIIPKPFRGFFFDKKLKKQLDRTQYDFILSLERTTRQNHVIAPSTHKGYMHAQNKWISDPIDWVQIYLERKAFAQSKIIYACSAMIKDEIEHYYKVPKDKIKVLYPPTDLAKFNAKASKAELRKELGWKEGVHYSLFVSTSHKRKGLPLLLEMYGKLDPEKYQLIVAGSDFESELSNVKSLGFVKAITPYYRAADLTLHPAVYEPFGQIIVESLACETPVIVSDRVGAKELITDDRGMVLTDLKADTWVSAIKAASMQAFFTTSEGIDISDLSLETHMKKMGKWAVILNTEKG